MEAKSFATPDCCGSTEEEGLSGDAFFSAEQSVCPVCRTTIQAKIVFRLGRVILKKRCLQHGNFEAVLATDMNYWLKSLSYTKPGQSPKGWSTEVEKGCPDDCGLCPDHEQHSCSPIIEISNHCDLQCPICIVWNKNNYNMTYDEFKGIVDGLIEKEGTLELVLLSGGEPTLHPEFFRFCEYITSKNEIKRVLISSHGIRLAKDEAFAKRFKELGLYLSLQFDSLNNDNYKDIRGANLLDAKMQCLQQCEKYDIPTIFVPTVAKGFNDEEIGAVVDFALSHDFVTSVTLQPAAYTGSGGTAFPQDSMQKLTQGDIHRLLQQQTDWLRADDFLPVPCAHPSCYTATYLLKLEDGSYIPLTRFSDIQGYLDLMTNKAIIGADGKEGDVLQQAIYNLWSAQAQTLDTEKVLAALKSVLNHFNQLGLSNELEPWKLAEGQIKAIFIHAFMDEMDFTVSRIRKCCTHYALPDGRLIPGCAYNTVHRYRDKRLGLEEVAIPIRTELTEQR